MSLLRPIWPTSYIPAPPIPRWFARTLKRLGGLNVYGEPNYRVIWAMDARTFRNGNPRSAKYPNPNDTSLGYACFWLERYATPEFFNRTQWDALRWGADEAGTDKKIDYLGPFPARGDYIGVAPLIRDNDEGEPYEMIPLSQQLLEELERRLAPGSQKITNMGIIEAQNRLKKAKEVAVVDKGLEEVRAHYRTNAEKINARASRRYVGLLDKQSAAAHARTSGLAIKTYVDEGGAVHKLWADRAGNGNAQIDFTMP